MSRGVIRQEMMTEQPGNVVKPGGNGGEIATPNQQVKQMLTGPPKMIQGRTGNHMLRGLQVAQRPKGPPPSLSAVRPISPPIISEAYMPLPLPMPPSTVRPQPPKRRSVSDANPTPPKTKIISASHLQPAPKLQEVIAPPAGRQPYIGIQRVGPNGQVYIELHPVQSAEGNFVIEDSPGQSKDIESAYFVTEDSTDTDTGHESNDELVDDWKERASPSTSDEQPSLPEVTASEGSTPKCTLFCYLFRIICRFSGNRTFTYAKIIQDFVTHAHIAHHPPHVLDNVRQSLLQLLLTNECIEFAGFLENEDLEDGFDFTSSHMKFSWKLAPNLNLSTISTAVASDSTHRCPTANSLLGRSTDRAEEEDDKEVSFLEDLLRSE
ncbi:hypothetical protein L596_028799 [Steinernema carpocapsae]|uniref:Uncharacterized protein n=1 Tax=Steinernema carpocapsae TaxID=34508 RepID=A0A4U5LZE0_STECR|nr:hypothetical protein L596_028799 [Steinernema carpocapsae]